MRRRAARLGGALATTVLVAATMTGAAGAQEPSGEISFFGWDVADLTTGLGKGFEAARVAFQEANPGVTVTFDAVPFGDFVSAATTRARAGDSGRRRRDAAGPKSRAGVRCPHADHPGRLGRAWRGVDRLGRRRHRSRRPDHGRRRAHRRPGCHLVLQQGAVRAGWPRPRGASTDLGGVRGRGRRAQGCGHHAHRGIGHRLVPGVVGVVELLAPVLHPGGRPRDLVRGDPLNDPRVLASLQPVAGDLRQRLVERGLRGQGVHGHGVGVHRGRRRDDRRDHHVDRQLERLGRPARQGRIRRVRCSQACRRDQRRPVLQPDADLWRQRGVGEPGRGQGVRRLPGLAGGAGDPAHRERPVPQPRGHRSRCRGRRAPARRRSRRSSMRAAHRI